MTAVTLPRTPAPRSATVTELSWGSNLTPPLGGAMQRLERLGTRYALDVEMPPMLYEPTGRQWIADLKRGKRERVLFEVLQPDFAIGAPGAPLVKTAVAGGTSVILKGLTIGYPIRKGQFLSFRHNSKRYLHSVQAEVIANGSGEATVLIDPMLRMNLSVNDVVDIAVVYMEGFIEGDEMSWSLVLGGFVQFNFRVVEAE